MRANKNSAKLMSVVLAAGTVLAIVPAAQASSVVDLKPVRLELPAPKGPFAVGGTELHLVDKDRRDPWAQGQDRELMVSVLYPARRGGEQARVPYMQAGAAKEFAKGAAGILKVDEGAIDWAGTRTHAKSNAPVDPKAGRSPVVLYDPGMYNERTLGTVTAEELASRGYTVVTVDHPGEAHAVEFPDGRVVTPSPKLTGIDSNDKRTLAALKVRVADNRFVLDEIGRLAKGANPDAESRRLPRGLGRALDTKRIGMFGHSLGGMATAETMRQDRRVDAGINLDGPLAPDWASDDPKTFLPVARTGLDRPFLMMGAEMPKPGGGTQPQNSLNSPSWKSLWEKSTGFKRDLHWPTAKHNNFTDYPALLPELDQRLGLPAGLVKGMLGTVDPKRSLNEQRTVVSAFFDKGLKRKHRPVLDAPSSALPDVDFVR